MLIVEVRAGPRELCIEVGHMLSDRLMSSGRLLVKRRNLICIFHVGGTKSHLKRHDVDVGEDLGNGNKDRAGDIKRLGALQAQTRPNEVEGSGIDSE